MKRVGTFLVAVALVLGMAGCGGPYDLTIASTHGGSVTTPGEGTFTYDKGTVVNLTATPDADSQFVRWAGDVKTVANVGDPTTTITMNGDYSITAYFITPMLAAGAMHTVGIRSNGTVVAVRDETELPASYLCGSIITFRES
jgi:hypothetical protein